MISPPRYGKSSESLKSTHQAIVSRMNQDRRSIRIISVKNLYTWDPVHEKWHLIEEEMSHDDIRDIPATEPLRFCRVMGSFEVTLVICNNEAKPLLEGLDQIRYEVYAYADPVLGPKDNCDVRTGPAIFASQPLQDAIINDNASVTFKIREDRCTGVKNKEYVLRFFVPAEDKVLQTYSYPIAVMTKVPVSIKENTSS